MTGSRTVLGLFIFIASIACGLVARNVSAEERSPATPLSRGEGARVAVIASDSAPAVERVRAVAPRATVIAVEPAPTVIDDDALAQAVDVALDESPHVLVVPFALRPPLDATRDAIARALARGVLVVAPVGDQGLSHARAPACFEGVLGVAAVRTGSNAGARVVAPGEDGALASAYVAGVAALAIGFDRDVPLASLGAALAAGPDPEQVLERLRPRSRAFVVSDARCSPAWVRGGGRLTARIFVRACGRAPARGVLSLRVGVASVDVPVGPLAPGEGTEVSGEVVVPASSEPAKPELLRDGGVVSAQPLSVAWSYEGTELIRTEVRRVVAHERVPGLALVKLDVDAAGASAVVENVSTDVPDGGEVRLVRGDVLLARAEVPRLARGERVLVRLEGRGSAWACDRIDADLELVRRPSRVRETIEARVPLAIEPPSHPRRRSGARR